MQTLAAPTLSCSVCPLGGGHPPYHPGCSSPMLLFPEWFRFTLGQLALSIQDKALEDVAKALKEDEELRDRSCLISLGTESAFTSPSYVYRVYCGDVPWTEGLEWLSENKELDQLALKAFRYSFKLLFDQVSLGPIESLEELFSTLEEYERDWYIALVADRGWQDCVLQEKPSFHRAMTSPW
ncbi:unnamed protein product [Oncorhynchus mykiss]|uniref:Pecanex-like protein n=1 Tax=Oncorhynchus mykiss TaxID=8022 RepID=A0A060WXW7_ONCMY|nr:unnamed protein product [Oncorhynchus mykiss]